MSSLVGNSHVDIITIAKDDEKGLPLTVESIRAQSHRNWKLLLVIGKSTDSTLEIANNYQALDARITVLKQADQGIYQAMNLGLRNSKSRYVWFLNSGDYFSNIDVLRDNVRDILNMAAGFIVGGYKVKNHIDSNLQRSKKLESISFAFNRNKGCHQAMIFDREKIAMSGGYDQRFQVASDFDLCLKVLKISDCFSVNRLNCVIAGDGFSDSNLFLMHKEKSLIRRKNLGNKVTIRILDKIWFLAVIFKIFVLQKMLRQNTHEEISP